MICNAVKSPMRPRELFRDSKGLMGGGGPRGSRGHLGDPLGPSGSLRMTYEAYMPVYKRSRYFLRRDGRTGIP